MPQSLSQILVHLVFSTKNREPLLANEIRDELHAYTGGIVQKLNGTLLKAGSVADHIHLLVAHPRTCAPSDLVKEIKTGSSKWLKSQGDRYSGFHWQAGYGAFSISPAHRHALEHYIENQAEHHRKVTFQEEYRRMLEKYGIEFDERYVWDSTTPSRKGEFRPFRAGCGHTGKSQGCTLGYRISSRWDGRGTSPGRERIIQRLRYSHAPRWVEPSACERPNSAISSQRNGGSEMAEAARWGDLESSFHTW